MEVAVDPDNPREDAVGNILHAQAPVGEAGLVQLNVIEELVLEATRRLVLFGSLMPVAVDAGFIRMNKFPVQKKVNPSSGSKKHGASGQKTTPRRKR